MKRNLIYILLFAITWSCTEDDDTEVSLEPEFNYVLPQGDHDYDARIVDYYNRFGCYFLYDYELTHAYWGVDLSLDKYNEYTITEPDQDHITPLLDLTDSKFLKFYPDTLLRRTLPLRVFLAGSSKDGLYWTEDAVLWGYHAFLVPGARAMEYTPGFITGLKKSFHTVFIEHCLADSTKMSDEFFQVSKSFYGLTFASANGFFDKYGSQNPERDWKSFLTNAAIHTREYLKSRYFTPAKDPHGLTEKKYEIVLKYMLKTYHVDLAAIANNVE